MALYVHRSALALVDVNHPQSCRQPEQVFALARGRVGDSNEPAVLRVPRPSCTLNDVRRNRDCCSSDLRLKSVALRGRHRDRRSIDLQDGGVSVVEHPKVSMIAAHPSGTAQADEPNVDRKQLAADFLISRGTSCSYRNVLLQRALPQDPRPKSHDSSTAEDRGLSLPAKSTKITVCA